MEIVNHQHPVQTFESWEWLVGVGAFLIVLGILALAMPVQTSVGLAWLLGALFLASGLAQLIHAVRFARSRGSVARFLLAALSLVAGVLTLRNPVAGTMGITLALAFYLIMSAVGRLIMARDIRHRRGWGWLVLSSIVSFFLGGYLIATFPITSLIVPGVFFGVDLLFFGSSLIASALLLRRLGQDIREVERRRAA